MSPTGFISSSTTSSAPSSTATANTTAPIIVPLYLAQLDNVTYYVPRCSDPPQTLWLSDGTNFTLSCYNITLATGIVIPIPEDPPQGTCQPSTVSGVTACFNRRFDWDTEDDSVTCQTAPASELFARDSGSVYANLSAIADAFSAVKDVTGAASAAEQGLSSVGCAAQQAFEQVAAYYFNCESNMSLSPLESRD